MIRVLVVEDDTRIARAHRSYVQRVDGFAVADVVHTGRDAIRTVTRAAMEDTPIDLVLMDIGLPDIDGLAVAAALARLRPRPDIITITSARDLEMVRAAVAHGVALYLLKPFPFASLRDRLEQYQQFRAALLTGDSALIQQDIDRAFTALRTSDPKAAAPKGIAPQTLEEVSRVVRAAPEGLTATEVGRRLGVSRVTAWRYLEQLATEGAVQRRTDYGQPGRPRVRYARREPLRGR